MIDIRNISPPAITQVDRAPRPVTRADPEAMPQSKLRSDAPRPERRRNPDRRNRGRDKDPIDRRLGADRRRRAVDIKV